MRALRERPRLIAAQLTMAAFALATALLIGSALAGDNRDRESRLKRQLAQASERQSNLGDQSTRPGRSSTGPGRSSSGPRLSSTG